MPTALRSLKDFDGLLFVHYLRRILFRASSIDTHCYCLGHVQFGVAPKFGSWTASIKTCDPGSSCATTVMSSMKASLPSATAARTSFPCSLPRSVAPAGWSWQWVRAGERHVCLLRRAGRDRARDALLRKQPRVHSRLHLLRSFGYLGSGRPWTAKLWCGRASSCAPCTSSTS